MDFILLAIFFGITEAIFFPTFYNALMMGLGHSYTFPALLRWDTVVADPNGNGIFILISFNAALLAWYLSFKIKHSGMGTNVDESVNSNAYGSSRFRSIAELQQQYPYYHMAKDQSDHSGLYAIYQKIAGIFDKKQ